MSLSRRVMSTAMGTVALAAGLLLVTSCSGAPEAADPTPSMDAGMDMSEHEPAATEGAVLEIEGSEFAFDPAELKAAAGPTTIRLTNKGASEHDIMIDELDVHLTAAAGASAETEVTLEPGNYELYCSIPGHRESGMQGKLTVS